MAKYLSKLSNSSMLRALSTELSTELSSLYSSGDDQHYRRLLSRRRTSKKDGESEFHGVSAEI